MLVSFLNSSFKLEVRNRSSVLGHGREISKSRYEEKDISQLTDLDSNQICMQAPQYGSQWDPSRYAEFVFQTFLIMEVVSHSPYRSMNCKRLKKLRVNQQDFFRSWIRTNHIQCCRLTLYPSELFACMLIFMVLLGGPLRNRTEVCLQALNYGSLRDPRRNADCFQYPLLAGNLSPLAAHVFSISQLLQAASSFYSSPTFESVKLFFFTVSGSFSP